jgi:hypothetical protein
MQVLYQLSYGPVDVVRIACHSFEFTPSGWGTTRGPGDQTWRQTATRRPWMVISSAGTMMGA